MECERCGRPISRYMKGECMACRYAAARSRAAEASEEKTKDTILKIDVSRLPAPPRPATKPYRGPTPEDRKLKNIYEEAKRQQEQKARFESRKRNLHPQNGFSGKEDAQIREMMKEGATIREIADALGRPYPSIVQRRKKLQKQDSEFTQFLREIVQ